MSEKISFVGAGGTGKTALINEIKLDFVGQNEVVFVEEAARQFFSMNYIPESDRFAFTAQARIQAQALANEVEAESSWPRLVFCDRSVLDAPVYVAAHGDRVGGLKLLDRIKYWLPTYSRIFIMDPMGVPFKNDAVRKENENTRQHIHETFLEFFTEHGIPYRLLSGTIHERKAAAEASMVSFRRDI